MPTFPTGDDELSMSPEQPRCFEGFILRGGDARRPLERHSGRGGRNPGHKGRPAKVSLPPLPPVVVLCMHSAFLGGSEQTALLSRVWAQGLPGERLVFVPYDTNRSYPALGDCGPLREAYDALLTVSLESSPADQAIKAAGANGERAARLEPQQVSPLFGTIYEVIVLLAHALNHSESHRAGLSGAQLGDHTGAVNVAGFSQRIRMDEKGRRLAQYIILDRDGGGSQLVPTHILDTGTWQVQLLGRAIHFPGGGPLARNSSCWFHPNTLCMRGAQPLSGLLALALACVLVLACGTLTCLVRLGVQQLQQVWGSHQILVTAQELSLIHGPLSRRMSGAGTGLGGQQRLKLGLGP
ncbi:hypothetical protein HPG69_012140 [Diceros bicornis minor]|uniref:Receptor ligand binding region domain-containing protein n=1 Tax=Diceros bicornis minor TaxID=77932 RepID=A0A7J7EI79_DICBM|nr:hypothetical protein HPG69_012140 [Diceros bicornis minor]